MKAFPIINGEDGAAAAEVGTGEVDVEWPVLRVPPVAVSLADPPTASPSGSITVVFDDGM
jgi:hypothetical protein